MRSNCIISFIVPLYNLQDWIISCLESISRAELVHDTFEVIVWDDGSTDGSVDLVTQFALRHPEVKLISRENHGVSYVRNQAIEVAKGQYVWFVDGDDELNPENVLQLVELARKSDLDMLLFNWMPIDVFGKQESIILHKVNSSCVKTGRKLFMENMITMSPWCFIYRRDFLIENGLKFPEDFKTCEDIQFNQKALWYSKRTMSSELVGYFYRQMNESATQGNAKRLVEDHIRRIPIEIDFFSKMGDWEYLTVVLYRNLRELNVWINVDNSDESVYDRISKTLSSVKLKTYPKLGFMSLLIHLTRVCPRLINRLQSLAKRIRHALH